MVSQSERPMLNLVAREPLRYTRTASSSASLISPVPCAINMTQEN